MVGDFLYMMSSLSPRKVASENLSGILSFSFVIKASLKGINLFQADF